MKLQNIHTKIFYDTTEEDEIIDVIINAYYPDFKENYNWDGEYLTIYNKDDSVFLSLTRHIVYTRFGIQ